LLVLLSNEPEPSRIWITDVTVVSPENLADLARGSVLIENERIARVERKASAKPPDRATVVSGEGGFLIPGLRLCSAVHPSPPIGAPP
jgi:imidazolonepropionase-like amidohydrolase